MKTFLSAAAALLASAAATAQVAAPPAPRDGVQTRAEAVQRVQTMFARADADRDGFITQADAQARRGAGAGVRAERGQRGQRAADPARRAQAFERLDANRDNMISRDEWARAEALRGQKMAQRQAVRGQRMAMRGGAMRGGAMLRMADANNDSRVSLQEATNAALQRFDRVDQNRDGSVTRDERQQGRRQWQQQAPVARN